MTRYSWPLFASAAHALVLYGAIFSSSVGASEVSDSLKAIGAVTLSGAGTIEATKAIETLRKGGAGSLLPILKSFDASRPLANNWLYNAAESAADYAAAHDEILPSAELKSFITDVSGNAVARRLAYELLLRREPGIENELIPHMIVDPAPEFRRDAVARLLTAGEAELAQGNRDAAKATFQQALSGAIDADQVDKLVEHLKEQGVEVNLQQHFGFVATWQLIGPFDNSELKGFDTVFPPEEKLDFSAQVPGKDGAVTWIGATTQDSYGTLDLAKVHGPFKGAIVYAAAVVSAPRERDAEIRLGTPNAWKLWVNQKLLFARDEYHRGEQMDQYRMPVHLIAGKNIILLKLCQNEQTEPWAQDYKFRLRVCDPAGAGIALQPEVAASSNETVTSR